MSDAPGHHRFDTVILAGGTARRMGGVDKPGLTVGGVSLVERALDAASDSVRLVVVGPHRPELDPSVVQIREQPPGSGPVAAIAAGLHRLGTEGADIVVVLAADIPFVDSPTVGSLVRACVDHSAAFVVDETGRTQYLLGAWSRRALTDGLSRLHTVEGAALREVIPRDHATIGVNGVGDCDTVDDLRRARLRAAGEQRRPTLDLDGARATVRGGIAPLDTRTVPLGRATGSVLAQPITAGTRLPAVDTSAMDGYAVAGDGPWVVRSDVAYAGTSGLPRLDDGQAVRIATGAAVPDGATAVIRDEYADRAGDTLVRSPGAPVRDDRRRAGDDWHTGDVLVPSGTVVSAAVMSVALGAERDALTVRGPVSARILSSGNEIRAHGILKPGQTRDTIGPVLPLYLRACGIEVVDAVHLEDSPTAFDEALAEPGDADLVVVIGATGGGAADRLRSALAAADARILVDRVSIRPGGSQITALLPSGLVVLGLPGNPLAAISTAMTMAPAIVDALTLRTVVPPRLGYLSNADDVRSSTARIVPVVADGTRWRARSTIRTAHLLHLTTDDALALVHPNATSDVPIELFLLPR